MNYFILSQREQTTNLPQIYNWYEKLSPVYMNSKDHFKIKTEQVFYIQPNKNHLFADLFLAPFLLLSEKAEEVFHLYDPSFIYKEVVLLDPINEKARLYYLPIFDPLPKEYMVYDQTTKSIEEVSFLSKKIKAFPFFQVSFKTNLYYIFREDFLESLLIRGGVGFSLIPITVKE